VHRRAGLPPDSEEIKALLQAVLKSPAIAIFGFYCHAGDSYASTSIEEASSFLNTEMQAVNDVARLALAMMEDIREANSSIDLSRHQSPFVLSVGSTPTAHSAAYPRVISISQAVKDALTGGELEIHAGNYPVCDLQQLHTGLVKVPDIAHRVLASVISYYPGRGLYGKDEAMCDAGGIAMSKDVGPIAGYGDVVPWQSSSSEIPPTWKLGRISQEHGILVRNPQAHETDGANADLKPGDFIWIIGQHACLTAAAHPWYYVLDSRVEGGLEAIQDVWIPWKGW
jgi:D-serine deaminase-like pyridoxal phosphate-dependent protein